MARSTRRPNRRSERQASQSVRCGTALGVCDHRSAVARPPPLTPLAVGAVVWLLGSVGPGPVPSFAPSAPLPAHAATSPMGPGLSQCAAALDPRRQATGGVPPAPPTGSRTGYCALMVGGPSPSTRPGERTVLRMGEGNWAAAGPDPASARFTGTQGRTAR